MAITQRTRILISLFFVVLTVNLLFFLVIYTEFPSAYREVLQVVTAFVTLLGVDTNVETVEASLILIAFMVSTIAAAYLLYIGLRVFRAGMVLQDAVTQRVHDRDEERS
jgi:glucan phosphoethanolaminetransferase (alkaline phosphatase superfamily)